MGFVPVLARIWLFWSGEPWEDLCSFFERVAWWQPGHRIRCTVLPPGIWRPNRSAQPRGLFPAHWVNSALSFQLTSLQAKAFQWHEDSPQPLFKVSVLSSPKGSRIQLYRELETRGNNDHHPGGTGAQGPGDPVQMCLKKEDKLGWSSDFYLEANTEAVLPVLCST